MPAISDVDVGAPAAGAPVARTHVAAGHDIDLEKALSPMSDSPDACIVCLEDSEASASNRLLRRICTCRQSAIHYECLEKLLNSRARRRLPLDERMRCAVCLTTYDVPFDALLLCESKPSRDTANTLLRRHIPAIRAVALVVCFASFMAFGVQLLRAQAGARVAYVMVVVAVVVILVALIVNAWKPKEQPPRLSDEALRGMDDETFWSAVVVPERGSGDHNPIKADQQLPLPEAARARVIVHLAPATSWPPAAEPESSPAAAPTAREGTGGAVSASARSLGEQRASSSSTAVPEGPLAAGPERDTDYSTHEQSSPMGGPKTAVRQCQRDSRTDSPLSLRSVGTTAYPAAAAPDKDC